MIHLRCRSEFSFRRAFGRLDRIAELVRGGVAGLADWSGTWGHVQWDRTMRARGKRALFGVELEVVREPGERSKQRGPTMALLAVNTAGLEELYAAVTLAYAPDHFYFAPRLSYADINTLTTNLVVLTGLAPDYSLLKRKPHRFAELLPASNVPETLKGAARLDGLVIGADAYYPRPEDRAAYEVHVEPWLVARRPSPLHLADEEELRGWWEGRGVTLPEDGWLNSERIGALCRAELPKAPMVKYRAKANLAAWCREGITARALTWSPAYEARMERELALIASKGFTDYFLIIADMVRTARRTMMVGPGRGSAAGSLVCYLLGITDIDPLVHGLLFERFIDITRKDLPDIDIDFPDVKREAVMTDLVAKYGPSRVGRLGTVNCYAAKSALNTVATILKIPPAAISDLSSAIITRSTGDARAQFSIADTFESLDIGRKMVEAYPGLRVAGKLEGHARHAGTHAAGYVVSSVPLVRFAPTDHRGTLQLDKNDAEKLNILKIDVLGLRTLTILEDVLSMIRKPASWLVTYPLTDAKAFGILNAEKFAGIFQFEGDALQILTRQMGIEHFNDIVAITALARPGPLHGGATREFVERRTGREPVVPLHEAVKELTAETYGTVIYQEQVMTIGRTLGELSWEDVSELRKAMSKSLGEEFFNTFWEKFKKGAVGRWKLPEKQARAIWDKVCTFGSWAFNKSHAVSYGMLSYWCAMLKAHHPLEFAAAVLRQAKDEDQAVKLLRELVEEGLGYVPVDAALSEANWTVRKGKLIGGLLNVKGIGPKSAADIVARRSRGEALTTKQANLLAHPITPYDHLFEGRERFGALYTDPKAHRITSKLTYVRDIQAPGLYVFLARIREKNLRDMNEYNTLVKRGGRRIEHNNLYLNLYLEDDTGTIFATVPRYHYARLGKPIIERWRIGDWAIWKGQIRDQWRRVSVERVRGLEPHHVITPPPLEATP